MNNVMRISNIGTDIVDINRFRKKQYNENKNFYEKIFTKSEIKYCLSFKNNSEHFAGKFAIKEAVKNAQKGWRKVYWKPGYGYISMKPVDIEAIDDQKFSDKISMEEICFNAFDGRIIDSMDHVQVKVWRGQKLNG